MERVSLIIKVANIIQLLDYKERVIDFSPGVVHTLALMRRAIWLTFHGLQVPYIYGHVRKLHLASVTLTFP
jgi:hypothetical protein